MCGGWLIVGCINIPFCSKPLPHVLPSMWSNHVWRLADSWVYKYPLPFCSKPLPHVLPIVWSNHVWRLVLSKTEPHLNINLDGTNSRSFSFALFAILLFFRILRFHFGYTCFQRARSKQSASKCLILQNNSFLEIHDMTIFITTQFWARALTIGSNEWLDFNHRV